MVYKPLEVWQRYACKPDTGMNYKQQRIQQSGNYSPDCFVCRAINKLMKL
jgi:hypothetical protein